MILGVPCPATQLPRKRVRAEEGLQTNNSAMVCYGVATILMIFSAGRVGILLSNKI